MKADILISASDANTLSDGGKVARRRMLQTLAVPGVQDATPLYVGKIDWEQPNGGLSSLHVFGVDPGIAPFSNPAITEGLSQLQILDAALIDLKTRSLEVEVADAVATRIDAPLTANDVQVRTFAAAAAADQRDQTTERPVGVVFGFGVVIGVLVGVIIVYPVLSSDVADHLKEYATLKAVGSRPTFFLSVIFEEAIVWALLGFVPGVFFSLCLY